MNYMMVLSAVSHFYKQHGIDLNEIAEDVQISTYESGSRCKVKTWASYDSDLAAKVTELFGEELTDLDDGFYSCHHQMAVGVSNGDLPETTEINLTFFMNDQNYQPAKLEQA